jgi:YesN/AraC family two-component response regulator
MVSLRCKIIVQTVLECLEVCFNRVELGHVDTIEVLSASQVQSVKTALGYYGLELMEDRESIIVEKIRNVIVEMIHYNEELPVVNFSNYLSEKLHYDYHYLSNLFSKVKGTTIEQYIIAHKIERVKILMMYDEFTLTEIAYRLHYSNIAHLSNQFKKVTGIPPSEFRKMKNKKLTALENI